MALAAVLFSSMNFFARLASATTSWATVGATRALVGAAIAFAVARARRTSLVPNNRRALFWRSFFGTCSMTLTFYALSSRSLSLGDTATLLNLAPVFLALLAPIFLRERTSGAVLFAIMSALGGVVLVVRPGFVFGAEPAAIVTEGPSAGVTAAASVLAALTTSIAMMQLRRVGQTETAEAIAFHFSLFAAASLTIVSIFDLRLPDAKSAIYAILAGICAGFGQLAMTRAYTLEQAAKVSAMSYLSVVTSALLGAAVLRERPSLLALLGMALVVGGGVIVTLSRASRA